MFVGMVQRTEFGAVIASMHFVLKSADGRVCDVNLKLGAPYHVGETTWACPCELEGLEPRYPDMHGEGSLQALCLALALVQNRLRDSIEDGWRFFDESGEERSFDSLRVLFGL
jgi:hypothetical protein